MKTGYNGRKRFSLKFPDGSIQRWGCCDQNADSGRTIEHVVLHDEYWLVQELHGENFPEPAGVLIPKGTMVCNGYYDHEHDDWLPVDRYYEQYIEV